jgi:hypothetical protein
MKPAYLLLVAISACLAACASHSNTTPSTNQIDLGAPDPNAPAECVKLRNEWCGHMSACIGNDAGSSDGGDTVGGDPKAIDNDCIAGFNTQTDCSKAAHIGASADACINDIDSIPCSLAQEAATTSDFGALFPASCRGVVSQ